MGLPWWLSGKESACQCGRPEFNPWVGKIPWRRKWQPALVFLPGKSHGQRSLVGYSPWSCKESDMTERLHFHFHTYIWMSIYTSVILFNIYKLNQTICYIVSILFYAVCWENFSISTNIYVPLFLRITIVFKCWLIPS